MIELLLVCMYVCMYWAASCMYVCVYIIPAMRHALHGILEPIPEDCDSHVLILFVSIWSSKQHVEIGVHEIGVGDGDISWALENRHQAQFCIKGCEMVHPHTARIRKDMHSITLSHSIHLEVVQYHIVNTTQNNAFAWWWWWWSKSKNHPIHPKTTQVANQFSDCSNNTNSTGQDIPCLYIWWNTWDQTWSKE